MAKSDIEVLLVIEGEIATTQLIERLLHSSHRFGVRYSKVHVPDLTFGHFHPHTVPLFVRCGDPGVILWIELLRRARHPYLYYIDDNFWEIAGDSPLASYYREPDVREALESAVSNGHQVLTNSEVLASFLRRFTHRLRILPAFFDFDLIEGCVPEDTPELRIGFAGSPTRGDDLDLIRPVIQAVLERVPNAVFEFAGVLPHGIQPGDRIRFFEHTSSYADFIQFQVSRNWAIGLAPLLDNPSNHAKTNNKYREYGACGIAGIYSDLPPYHGSVEPGATGLLVGPDCQSWLAAILQLAHHPEQRRLMGTQAERDVRRRFCVKQVAGEWVECLREVQIELANRPSSLRRAYLGGIAMRRLLREIHILWLQVKDAHQIGGIGMVASKTVQRMKPGRSRKAAQ